MIPVTKMDRAKKFYQEILGLPVAETTEENVVVFLAGGSPITLYPREAPSRADHTLLSFEVKEIERVVRALSERGVHFEEYDYPNLKTVNKIATHAGSRAAWFRDPEGNILCLHEPR
jgi:predicted enzyme related to lactoylglutathione lyase